MNPAFKKIACLLVTVLLCGCSATGLTTFSIEELLRAPQPSPEQNAVQKALNAHFGETLQLKYPRFGKEMTPFIIRDFDNDNQAEAAVLYTSTAKGQNVHLAILENKSGTWEVVQEIEGLAGEVLWVDSVKLYSDRPECIAIGYTTQSMNDKFLAVYNYTDETITPVFTPAYSSYAIKDIDNDLLDEIIYSQMSNPSLLVVETIENELKTSYTLPLDERFTSCINISAGLDGTIAVDGNLQTSGLSSNLYSLKDGSVQRIPHEKTDIFSMSTRYLTSLLSCDIDDNNSVEIPCVTKSVDTFNTMLRFYIVSWHDFTLKSSEKRYGIYDAKYNYFVRLPFEWKDEFNLVDDGTADGGWQLRSKDGYKNILSAKLAPRAFDMGSYTQVAVLGEKRLMLNFSGSCTKYQIETITSGISVF